MKQSKYVGKNYQGWTVDNIYLAANYSHGTRHNAYRYTLERNTSDGVCIKKIAVSGRTMTKIARGTANVEAIADRKGINHTNYEFIKEK